MTELIGARCNPDRLGLVQSTEWDAPYKHWPDRRFSEVISTVSLVTVQLTHWNTRPSLCNLFLQCFVS